MRLDNAPTDAKPHARALRFGGEEGLEKALDLAERKPDAGNRSLKERAGAGAG
jgi:hypothetical protein